MRGGTSTEAPTFGVEPEPVVYKLLRFLWRPRVRAVWAILAALLVGMSVYYRVVVEPTLTVRKYTVSVPGSNDRLVIWVDDARSAVVVTGAQRGIAHFVVAGDRMLVPRTSLDPGYSGEQWISLPTHLVLDAPHMFDPGRVKRAFSLGAKDCFYPAPIETDAIIRLLEHQFGRAYEVCDSAAGNGVDVLVDFRWVSPRQLVVPLPADTATVESLGSQGDVLTSRAREAFETATVSGA